MASAEEKLRVSILAQEALREVVDQQAVELRDLRDFSEAERSAMIDEKKAVLDGAKRQVDELYQRTESNNSSDKEDEDGIKKSNNMIEQDYYT